ncbi:MAG: ATP-binding cassette domain-containing protein, partial [Defluviitaleaceae bacterium]|nr:ATP-binding cassette domain-containing protein [Defluviitaleaceae bacterium]
MPQANEEPASNIGRLEGLAIENLSFSYDDKEVLKGVSLQMKPGDIAGIIGESGSGKSTLTKILMGFYKPSAGNITLKGSRGTARDFLNYIAYVPSNDFLFSGSISENICMSADVDKAKMEQAAKAAGIYDFILSLENKFDTFIGEGSNKLSSGQSQRIGIARALYANKPILIFDEPTSNLDSDAIGTLHASIREISRDKICIIVTHDLATRDICSKVYSINDGVITYTQNEGEYPLRKVS